MHGQIPTFDIVTETRRVDVQSVIHCRTKQAQARVAKAARAAGCVVLRLERVQVPAKIYARLAFMDAPGD